MCVFSSCVSVGLFPSLVSGGLTTGRVACGRFMWRHWSLTPRHGRGQIEHVRVAVDCSRAVNVHISYVPTSQFLSRRALFYWIIFWHSYCSSCVFLWGIQIVKGHPLRLEHSALRPSISWLHPHDFTDCHAIRNQCTWYSDGSTNMQEFFYIPLISRWRPLCGSFVQVVASSELISFKCNRQL